MNCDDIRELFSDYYDGEDDTGEVAAHLLSCAACADEYQTFAALFDEMKNMPMPELPAGFHQRLMHGVNKEARRKKYVRYMPFAVSMAASILVALFWFAPMFGDGEGDFAVAAPASAPMVAAPASAPMVAEASPEPYIAFDAFGAFAEMAEAVEVIEDSITPRIIDNDFFAVTDVGEFYSFDYVELGEPWDGPPTIYSGTIYGGTVTVYDTSFRLVLWPFFVILIIIWSVAAFIYYRKELKF